jgi:Ca2+/Na+ antiporter
MTELLIKIPKTRAELPAIIVTGVICFVGFAFHFGFFSWTGGFIYLAICLPLIVFLYLKRRGEYYVKVNENGIEWRQGIISKLIYLPWDYVQRVDYLVYEINFMLKETAQVVSFATSGLTEEETDALKAKLSEILGERKESNPV